MQGLSPVPRKMVKFNPGLRQILSKVFIVYKWNSSLQKSVESLLHDTVMSMITQNVTLSNAYRKVKYKNATKF